MNQVTIFRSIDASVLHPDECVLFLFEPRWHGFAEWHLTQFIPIDDIVCAIKIDKGWTRRERGAPYERIPIRIENWRRPKLFRGVEYAAGEHHRAGQKGA